MTSDDNKLALYAWPQFVPVDEKPDWVRQTWVVRTHDAIDIVAATHHVQEIQVEIATANNPSLLEVVVIDEKHVALEIQFPNPAGRGDRADDATVAQWAMIRGFDQLFCIEDLQGLPRRCWGILRDSRSAAEPAVAAGASPRR